MDRNVYIVPDLASFSYADHGTITDHNGDPMFSIVKESDSDRSNFALWHGNHMSTGGSVAALVSRRVGKLLNKSKVATIAFGPQKVSFFGNKFPKPKFLAMVNRTLSHTRETLTIDTDTGTRHLMVKGDPYAMSFWLVEPATHDTSEVFVCQVDTLLGKETETETQRTRVAALKGTDFPDELLLCMILLLQSERILQPAPLKM